MSLLELREVSVRYGAVSALDHLSLEVAEGGFVSLLGANGAGKSTTLKVISGLVRPGHGCVLFRGKDVGRLDPAKRLRLGIAHCPEQRHVFPYLTTEENLRVAGHQLSRAKITSGIERALALFPALESRLGSPAGSLSGGEQQMLAVARSLMTAPQLLLLDEPSLGLAPKLTERLVDTFEEINKAGTSVLLVEQALPDALRLSSFAYVLRGGQVWLKGDSASVARNPGLREAYLVA